MRGARSISSTEFLHGRENQDLRARLALGGLRLEVGGGRAQSPAVLPCRPNELLRGIISRGAAGEGETRGRGTATRPDESGRG